MSVDLEIFGQIEVGNGFFVMTPKNKKAKDLMKHYKEKLKEYNLLKNVDYIFSFYKGKNSFTAERME